MMKHIVEELKKNKAVFIDLLTNISEDLQIWKPFANKWSLLEIICHLYDEERLDFRFRTKWVLERANEVPPPFNPLNWVKEHSYMKQNLNDMLHKFVLERESSIQWLETLENPNWNNSFEHSKHGFLTADYFLNNWLAHDYLHIRQITKQKFDYLKLSSGKDLNYAGTW